MTEPQLKIPYPRQLTKSESLDSLSHWQSSVRNYFRRSPHFQEFFKRASRWNCNAANYGFTGDDADDRSDNLESLLDTISSFLPGPYITHQITKSTTTIQSVWDIIWDHYGVKPSQFSILDYMDITMSKDDRPIDLYDKLIYHSMNHLCTSGTNGGTHGGGVLAADDVLTLCHRNHIAMDWLNRINPKLLKIIRVDYSKDLKSGVPLTALVKTIAENMDSLLARVSNPNFGMASSSNLLLNTTNMVTQFPPNDIVTAPNASDPHPVMRVFNRPQTSGPRFNVRGRGQYNNQRFRNPSPRFQRSHAPAQNNHCNSCFSLGQKLSLKVDFNHSQQFCPQLSSVRSLVSDTFHSTLEEQDPAPIVEEPSPAEEEFEGKDNSSLPPSHWFTSTNNMIRKIENRFNSNILKAKSPSAKVQFMGKDTFCIIDEGSELCCIDQSLALSNNIPFSRTREFAVGAGSHSMTLVGETDNSVVLSLQYCKFPIKWDIGKCVIVRNLGCPILIGEPGKSNNNILTDPTRKLISTHNTCGQRVTFPYFNNATLSSNSFICRTSTMEVLYPKDSLSMPVPAFFSESDRLYFTPRRESTTTSPPSQICKVTEGHINLVNNTDDPILIKKNSHFGDIFSDIPVTSPLPMKKSPSSPPPPTSPTTPKMSYTDEIKLDPDNMIPPLWRSHFSDMMLQFSDIIDPNPGMYNNYFGNVDCSLNFIKEPPASIKARLPSYSHEKLVEMANMMDQMETMGVLAKPEDVGIIPRNVHTSYLVPKTDGRYRFVTDFTNLLPFIGKLEVVTPSISHAKRVLSTFKYHIELDLSHCFWQGSMSPSDSQYLATPHPFGGLRVYTREPQGIRNASEHNSERLARIFGDLERDQKMCRMADGLYIGGSTLEELSNNLSTVFNRAKLAGLTFKPSKIVVCPKETILFGWKKSGDQWSPTNHVVSPLSQAPLPKTVKQLRGFIGAYRQLSSTIKNYSMTLGNLEKHVGGKTSREHVKWTNELRTEFENAKTSLTNIQSIAIPKPSDALHIYPDFSETANAVGSHLVIHREEDNIKLNGGYFSIRLEDCQTRWTPCEKECLGIKLSIQHFKPFIQNSTQRTIIHTDNLICVQAWNRLKLGHISSSSKVASFLSSLSENNVEIVHFPGSQTKVADFSSRNPLPCNEKRCQICSFAFEQITIGDHSKIMKVTVEDLESGSYRIPLSEKPTWLKLQKEDDTHRRLYKLITSGGLQPEPKLRGHTDLKRLYNLYRKGLLSIDNLGLITVKHIDTKSGLEYDAISVPCNLYPGLIQSLHIKLNHPSRAQLHKFVNRHFFCIGTVQTIDSVHISCEVCASLSVLPKVEQTQSTSPNHVFGENFSADVLVSDGQKIFICREKLSQYTFSKIIDDESTETLRDAIVESVVQTMPTSGAIIRLDPAPAHQSLAKLQNDSLLSKFNIQIELGRTHNLNKNPIAENAIKEFRKERLRLNKQGGPISELDRIIITKNMNQRIRNRGLASKEIFHRRSLTDNKPIDLSDKSLSEQQFDLRTSSHPNITHSHNEKVNNYKVGDRVFIRNDLNKLRGREEYFVVHLYTYSSEEWVLLRKSEKSLRNKTYDLKISEIIPASSSFGNLQPSPDSSQSLEPFHGFSSAEIPKIDSELTEIIDNLPKNIPSTKGRPSKLRYPDIIEKNIDYDVSQSFYGFPTQSRYVYNPALKRKPTFPYCVPSTPPSHGWDQSVWFAMLDDDIYEQFGTCTLIDNNYYLDLLFETSPEDNSTPPLIENNEDFWAENPELPEYDFPDVPFAAVAASIENCDLTLVDPNWESPCSLFIKNRAARTIQRAWRQSLSSNPSVTGGKYNSVTDPFFLVKIPIVSDSESELSDDTFHSPMSSRPATPSLAHHEDPFQPETVYNITSALESLQLPLDLDRVQNVSQPLDALLNPELPSRPRRNVQRLDYKTLNSKGFSK